MYRNKFKKFGGDYIPDIIEYLKEYIEKEPNITISVGCDSIQKRKRTIYACTIMLYNTDIKNGAHVVFFRENVEKIRDNFERLNREAKYCFDISEFLDNELNSFYVRKDLSEIERKRYKYHLDRCDGKNENVELHNIDKFIQRMILSDYEKTKTYKLVDIHVDFNPSEGNLNEKGVSQNKSYVAYRSFVPWLRGFNYRVFAKPLGYASTSAADLLLQD